MSRLLSINTSIFSGEGESSRLARAYLDHIARAGVTFRYTDKGSVERLTGKTAYVFAARGGRYNGSALDTQTTYIRNFLG